MFHATIIDDGKKNCDVIMRQECWARGSRTLDQSIKSHAIALQPRLSKPRYYDFLFHLLVSPVSVSYPYKPTS